MMIKSRRMILALLLMGLAILLAGCSGRAFGATSWPGLAADEETAYVAFGDAVYAIDLSNGSMRWRFPREADRSMNFYAPPEPTSNGLIIVGGYDNNVYALDKNGNQVWSFEEARGRIIGAPAAADRLVLVPSSDGSLYALDIETGALVWHFDSEKSLWSAARIDGDRVYIGSLDHNVYALDLEDGSVLWQQDLGVSITGTPALADDLLLVGTFGDQMVALDRETGTRQWALDTEGWVWSSPVVVNGEAYFGDVAGNFFAITLENQQVRWTIQPNGPITAAPIVIQQSEDEGIVYFMTDDGTRYAMDTASGDQIRQTGLEGRLLADPVVIGDKMIVATMESEALLVALEIESGAQIWEFLAEQ